MDFSFEKKPGHTGKVDISGADGSSNSYRIYVPDMVRLDNIMDLSGFSYEEETHTSTDVLGALMGIALDDHGWDSTREMPTGVSLFSLAYGVANSFSSHSTTVMLKATEYKNGQVVLELGFLNELAREFAGQTVTQGLLPIYGIMNDLGPFASAYAEIAPQRAYDPYFYYLARNEEGKWCGYERKYGCETYGLKSDTSSRRHPLVNYDYEPTVFDDSMSKIIDEAMDKLEL
jgi:hypothetical protein